jgi:hypothetical protein
MAPRRPHAVERQLDDLWISKKGSWLKRDDGVVLRIPKSVADRIRKRLPLG